MAAGTGIYISIPFCAQKCTYCNFASAVLPEKLRSRYLAALQAELRAGRRTGSPETLYLGGGTPSLLEEPELRQIMAGLPPAAWQEATIEASPGTVTAARAGLWKELGLDRVSLGAQSFVRQEIAATGRRHSAEQIAREVELLRDHNITDINLDLIAGLPHQTRESWQASLDWVERLRPPHVSVYMLEVDDDSRLGRELRSGGIRYGAGAVPDEGEIAEFYSEAVRRLEDLGIRRYEISNFAQPGWESQHNLKYWRREPYRGFGADAHSFAGAQRWANVETAAEYVERWQNGVTPVAYEEQVTSRQAMEEHFFTGLRQMAGIEPAEEEWRRFDVPIRRLIEEGLLAKAGRRLQLTGEGVLFSNEVFQEFIS